MPSPAAQRRYDFIGSLFTDAPRPLTEEAAAEIIERILAEAPALGRTERWRNAILWIEAGNKEQGTEKTWLAFQGSIGLGWAAE